MEQQDALDLEHNNCFIRRCHYIFLGLICFNPKKNAASIGAKVPVSAILEN